MNCVRQVRSSIHQIESRSQFKKMSTTSWCLCSQASIAHMLWPLIKQRDRPTNSSCRPLFQRSQLQLDGRGSRRQTQPISSNKTWTRKAKESLNESQADSTQAKANEMLSYQASHLWLLQRSWNDKWMLHQRGLWSKLWMRQTKWCSRFSF